MTTETRIAGKAACAEVIKTKVSSEHIILGVVMLLTVEQNKLRKLCLFFEVRNHPE